MSDRFNVQVAVDGVPSTSMWDVFRLVVDEATRLYKSQAKGFWLLRVSGRTASSTYHRKSVSLLRRAFEDNGASVRTAEAWVSPTIGAAKISLVTVTAYFDGDEPLRISASGSDGIKVEQFGAALQRALSSSAAITQVAPGCRFVAGKVESHSNDSGSSFSAFSGGLATWLLGVVGTVVTGLLVALILRGLGQ